MSALPVSTTPTAPTRPALRLVATARPRGGATSLAPSGPVQAWRRRIGALLVVASLLALAIGGLSGPSAAMTPTVPVGMATVVVEPGQTLWDVAGVHAPDGVSTPAYVRQLAEVNGITGGAVEAWQVLLLPVG